MKSGAGTKSSESKDKLIQCRECGSWMRNITWTHLKRCCGLRPDDYKKKHGVEYLFSEDLRSTAGVTKDKMIGLYGEEEGMRRWKSYCDRQAITNTFEYKREKYGMTEDEFKQYNSSRAATLENLIRRHGVDLGTKKWDDYCARQSYAGCKAEYFIEKYGEEEGRLKYEEINRKKTLSYDSLIEKHNGDEDAAMEELQRRIEALSVGITTSRSATKFFQDIQLIFNINPTAIRFEYGRIDRETKDYYFYDYIDFDRKLCIEYNGDIFHGNPLKYGPDDVPKFRGNTKTAAELWERDVRKMKTMVGYGFDYIIIWEGDVRKSFSSAIGVLDEFYDRRAD